ncbi:hypothetical protein J1C49_00195 [Cognatishimia sp. F0-27]|nr:hypothetical protein [Cognatishimia sp. F0-27]
MVLIASCALSVARPLQADPPEIVDVDVSVTSGEARFSVTIAHPDTGWDHYADGWRVELEDGTVLDTRVLYHPHVEEQPFTRSLGGVALPDGTKTVHIRAKCSVDGWSTDTVAVPILP